MVATGELIRSMNYVEDITATLRRICVSIPSMTVEERTRLAESLRAVVTSINSALADLEKDDPLKAQIVNLRYFTGMSMEETAQVLGLSERTAQRHWRFIKAWLKSRLEG